MTTPRKNLAVYALLALAWPAMVGWLVFEHGRVVNLAQETLLIRAREISNTVAIVSRSGGPGIIYQGHLQESLNELVRARDLITVQLLNSEGEVVVAAGQPLKMKIADLPQQGVRWDRDRVTVVNLVDFGTATDDHGTTRPPTIVLPTHDDSMSGMRRLFRIPQPRPGEPGRQPPLELRLDEPDRQPPPEARSDQLTTATAKNSSVTVPRGGPDGHNDPSGPGSEARRHDRRGDRSKNFGRPPFGRPPWMDEERYQTLLRKRGLHGFVLVLSTDAKDAETQRDLWLRFGLGALALLAVGGLALAWRNTESSTHLQMRLVRAHELNMHLQEMNLAAAGLAHETRNPLNIVRGLAQMIAQREDLSADIRERTRQITDEVDRVTGRLNEFINYSRPPEPRPAPTNLAAVAGDVARTLESDLADKRILFSQSGPALTVNADESLLRQVLFNLLLNAIQSVPAGGRVNIAIAAGDRGEASLSVDDNGPGVPDSIREEIFRPYYTTREHGSGLGLAVVNQIVLAHRWEIEYVRNSMGGATFRISGLQIL